jgi:hypothetical protein
VGGGGSDARVIAGMLGVHHNALRMTWKNIAEKLGLLIIEVGTEIMASNRMIEKVLSPSIEGKYALSLCGDARWDKRGSSRNYSSLSGCAVKVGCRSQLVWDVDTMSNQCIKCTRGLAHDDDVCPQNVDCSSKAMEAVGSCRIVMRICDSADCYLREFVSDDGSSTKKVLRHSYADQLEKGTIDELPKYVNGKKKTDNGLLPISHPAITWLADRNHRIRSVSKKVFMLCNKKKAKCIGNNHDAERIKRCIAYAVRQNCLSDAAQLSKSIKTDVKHHFGDHDECRTWCRVKPLVGDERTSQQLKYRNKEVKGGTSSFTTT